MNEIVSCDYPIVSRAVAAIRLGFFCRYMGLDFLGACLVVLVDDIRPNAYVGLQQKLSRINQDFLDHHAEIERNKRDREWGYSGQKLPEWEVSPWDVQAFCQLADRALTPDNSLRIWYELGALLGDCEIQAARNRFIAADLERIVVMVRKVPRFYVDDIRALKQLLESNAENSSPEDQLRRAIELSGLSGMNSLTHNPRNAVLIAFLDAIVLDLSHVQIFQDHRSPDARNAWIYRRVFRGDAYKQIIIELRQQTDWESIHTIPGIKEAARRYAERHQRDQPPARKGGRPRSAKT